MGVPGDLTLVDNHGHNQLTVQQILYIQRYSMHDFICYVKYKLSDMHMCIYIYILTEPLKMTNTPRTCLVVSFFCPDG